MRALVAALVTALVIGLAPLGVSGEEQEYDGCTEQFYDSIAEPCGGGHQHVGGKRDETSLERSRHRHRYLEDQIAKLQAQVAALTATVDQLKKSAAQ